MGVGENIRIFRIMNNMTQEELAEKMGYRSKASINKIEKGVNSVPLDKIQQFAEVLHTSPSVLLGEESSTSYVLRQQMARLHVEEDGPEEIALKRIIRNMNKTGLKRLLAYAEDIQDKYRKGEEDAQEEEEV